MIIKKLELSNFRNYGTLEVELDKGINIFYGDNAQGKTNILEALYMACTTKSPKATRDSEVIRFGEKEAHLRMYVEKGGIDRRIDMHLKKNSPKGVALDGIPLAKASEIYVMMNIISFSPDDLAIIKSGPSERRSFIDMALSQLDKMYLYSLSSYKKALNQRNILLKQIKKNDELENTLSVWDEQLTKFGGYIIGKRAEYVKEIGERASVIHSRLSGGKESLTLKYLPNVSTDMLSAELGFSHEKDIVMKSTTVGPHRDDIGFDINSDEARKFGSQGQQRTVALTLKLAEIEIVKEKTGDKPVLLLDDVLSELDRSRQTELLGNIEDIQTVITCTGLEEFVNGRIKLDRIYKVSEGRVSAAE